MFAPSRTCLQPRAAQSSSLVMSAIESAAAENGIHTFPSPVSFAETVARITTALQSHGIKIFATIDQQAEAKSAGLEMLPVTLILFGNPKAGTPLMIAQPASALDLPLKAAIWQSESGHVFVSLNTASHIISRHALPPQLESNIAPPEKLIANALA
jgi:uncharacterized protein (DUF302 family)